MLNAYFDYLCRRVEQRAKTSHKLLLYILFRTEFVAFVPNDDNRCADGLALRDDFYDEEGAHTLSILPNSPCSMLEMLVALSDRLEFELSQSRFEKSPAEWFWILIDNLGLTWAVNAKLNEHKENVERVREVVADMINRTYAPDGDGGLFPLVAPKGNQREVEIWYQMTQWVIENYPIG